MKTILVVEPEPDILRILEIMLENLSHKVLTAPDVPKAETILKEKTSNLVILELNLPGIDGSHLIELIRTDETQKNLPVIVLTTRRVSPDQAEKLNVNAFLTKPFTMKDVSDTIEKLLG